MATESEDDLRGMLEIKTTKRERIRKAVRSYLYRKLRSMKESQAKRKALKAANRQVYQDAFQGAYRKALEKKAKKDAYAKVFRPRGAGMWTMPKRGQKSVGEMMLNELNGTNFKKGKRGA